MHASKRTCHHRQHARVCLLVSSGQASVETLIDRDSERQAGTHMHTQQHLVGLSIVGIRCRALAARENRLLRPRGLLLDGRVGVKDALFDVTGCDIDTDHSCTRHR